MDKNEWVQIIATISPQTGTKQMIQNLYEVGMDVVRLNFSWGTYEEHEKYISNIREVASSLDTTIPIIQDLSGPRIQTGKGHSFDSDTQKVITQKDLRDLTFGLEQNIDYIAISYVGGPEDIIELQGYMEDVGKLTPIIAKIERPEAVDQIDDIISVADGIMIARGDLGDSIPFATLPFVQRDIIQKANHANKPVIVATEMLMSMVENDRPSRAEVTDVATAVIEGTDAVMLSNETAAGSYPVEAVSAMQEIINVSSKERARTMGIAL